MNDLDRIRKLAGISSVLTEGEITTSNIDSPMDEKAPPGMEDTVMNLKKEYPGHPEKAFATAWSIYNKKHNKTEDVAVIETVDNIDIISAIETLEELLTDGTDPGQAIDSVISMLRAEEYAEDDIAQMLTAMSNHLNNMDNDEDGICPTCNGSGEGMHDGTTCSSCGGSGEVGPGGDPDDFDEPDYYPEDDWAGDLEEGVEHSAEDEEMSESFDLNNGYNDIDYTDGTDYFPDGADSPVTSHAGPSGARMGDNPEQKKMEVAEAHKELVYNYRKFLKESAKK